MAPSSVGAGVQTGVDHASGVKGTRDGSKVRLTFDDNGAVRQYLEGKHVSPILMKGFISRQEGAELRAAAEFVRHLDTAPGSVIAR